MDPFSVSSNQQVVHVWCFEADSFQFKIISLSDWVQNYALKSGGTNMVTSTLEQKERMIEFYNRRANEGMHADLVSGTSPMREKRLDLLKESQIRSWLSSYQQKRKRENERLAADLWQLQGQLTFSSWASTAASVKGNNLPTTAPDTTITPCTSATTQNENILSSIKTDAILNSS